MLKIRLSSDAYAANALINWYWYISLPSIIKTGLDYEKGRLVWLPKFSEVKALNQLIEAVYEMNKITDKYCYKKQKSA